jgi:hypothetical protein
MVVTDFNLVWNDFISRRDASERGGTLIGLCDSGVNDARATTQTHCWVAASGAVGMSFVGTLLDESDANAPT